MKLKPCPFCGEDGAKICEVPVESDYKIIVRCTWCCVQTTPRNNEKVASLDWNNRARVDMQSADDAADDAADDQYQKRLKDDRDKDLADEMRDRDKDSERWAEIENAMMHGGE